MDNAPGILFFSTKGGTNKYVILPSFVGWRGGVGNRGLYVARLTCSGISESNTKASFFCM
jgi:hypothetical protein